MGGRALGGRSPASLGIAHKLNIDPQSGSVQLSVPIPLTQGRDGFTPNLSLEYGSSGGSSIFGRGWGLSGLLGVSIDSSEGVPRYSGNDDFSFSGCGPLVPFNDESGAEGSWQKRGAFRVRRYRPRRERGHSRIERFVNASSGATHWQVRDARNSIFIFGSRDDGLSRLADPRDAARVFTWLPEIQLDSRGNAIRYDYVAENLDGVDVAAPFEQANLDQPPTAQRYLKRIRWGNIKPLNGPEDDPGSAGWHFELVFDYGDHDENNPRPEPDKAWTPRPDPSSVSSPGFTLRTYRLCRRILLFHRFESLGADPVLVQSTILEHEFAPEGSRLVRIRRVGRRTEADGAQTREQPPLDFTYSKPRVGDSFVPAPARIDEQVPHGIDGPRYQLVDLWGEGLPGLLIESTGAWFYRRNLGAGRFGAEQLVVERPSHGIAQVAVHDFDGDGNPELTVLASRSAGYYAFDRNAGSWSSFQPFPLMPHLDSVGATRWFDADGDGRADLVTGEGDRLSWYRSLGREGFEPATDILQSAEAKGAPWRSDKQNHFFFADMTGDGLPDQVLLKNGVAIYWPNRGNGRFGAPVTMDGAPRFASEGEFDPGRVIFADVDGSGTSDIVYVGQGELSVWTNACGNQLLEPRRIEGLPRIDSHAALAVYDFLGDGTPCLVWSVHSASGLSPLQYLPLTGGIRPNLLERVANNMGLEHRLNYSTSATHYLRDQASGHDWATKLPKHHVVADRHEVADLIGGTSSASLYFYHDGSFDGVRRSFRGFGYVETADLALNTDTAAEAGLPPTAGSWSRTWFHLGSEGVSSRQAMWRGDPEVPECRPYVMENPDALGVSEAADAAEAVAGLAVRNEIFAMVGGSPAANPLRIENRGLRVRRLQAGKGKRRACFETIERECQSLIYEGQIADPLMRHQLVFEVSAYGIPLTSCEVAYPRKAPEADAAQQELLLRAKRVSLFDADIPDRLEFGIPLSEERFSIEDPALPKGRVYEWSELSLLVGAALSSPKPFDAGAIPAGGSRRLAWSRSYYWNEAGNAAMPFGEVSTPALIHHRESAVFTPGLVADIFGPKVDDARLTALGYALADGHWWRPGETMCFGPAKNFRRVEQVRRSDGAETLFEHDATSMLVAAVTDALGNRTEMSFDYHLLEATSVRDPNGCISEARYDPLGVMIASSLSGTVKLGATPEPYGFARVADVTVDLKAAVSDVLAAPAAHIGGAAATTFYDLMSWAERGEPPVVVSLGRENLVNQGDGFAPAPANDDEVTLAVAYHDGFGRNLQSKLRVASGPAVARAADGSLVLDAGGRPAVADSVERWQVSGHRLFDQRQRPVRTFEPFFSGLVRYEGDRELQSLGTATIVSYDALGRQVRQDYPNGTFSNSEHSAWSLRSFDANDTVDQSAYKLTRSALAAANPERKALEGALAHAGTPVVVHYDPAGRTFLTEETDGLGNSRSVRVRFAPDGGIAASVDPRAIVASEHWRDMVGRELRGRSSDAGETLVLYDALDRPSDAWDALGNHLVRTHDLLDRQTALDVELPGGGVRRAQEIVYGEDAAVADAAACNLRGRIATVRDDAGQRNFDCRTIDGLPLRSVQRIIEDIQAKPDWANPAGVALLDDEFSFQCSYDGVGRTFRESRPDGTSLYLQFERGGGLRRIEASTRDGLLTDLPIVIDATANARGQRERFELGCGVTVTNAFDPETWRTTNIKAVRGGAAAAVLQDIDYTFDPVGNVVSSLDKVHQPGVALPLITGLAVSAEREYSYDGFYQLRRSTGRVHKALLPDDHRTDAPNAGSYRGSRRLSLNDGAQIERFVETFNYDLAGNIIQLKHVGPTANWTNDFWVSATSNRSLAALDSNGNPVVSPEGRFDACGNMTSFPHLSAIAWDYRGMMASAIIIDRSAAGQANDAEHYIYDATGRRVRKRSERMLADGLIEAIDTLYLDGCEIKRIIRDGNAVLERLTSHVGDGLNRLALIHRWSLDPGGRETDDITKPKVRYQLPDHLGSALLQLDDSGALISMEEYLPFGGTAFIAGDNLREIELSAYRFCGKERDDATGLCYFGRRYFAPWLNRWISPDPAGDADGLNRYLYVHNNPATYYDPTGLQAAKAGEYTEVYGKMPPQVRDALNRKSPAEQKRLAAMDAKGDFAWSWDRTHEPVFGTRAQIREIVKNALAGGKSVQRIILDKPPSHQGKKKGAHAGAAKSPRAPANDDLLADPSNGGHGHSHGHGGGARKAAHAKAHDPAQAQDGVAGGAKNPAGESADSKGTGKGSDSGGTNAHPGDGSAPGDHPGNGDSGGVSKGAGGLGEGPGSGQQGQGTGGGGTANSGTGSGTSGAGAGSGTGSGKGPGDGKAGKSDGSGAPGGTGPPGSHGDGSDLGEPHPGAEGNQNLPGVDPKGDPSGSANGSSTGRIGGHEGGDQAGTGHGATRGTGGNGAPGAERGAQGGGGVSDGSQGAGGGGQKPKHWYQKVLATIGGVMMAAFDIVQGFAHMAMHPFETIKNIGQQMSKAYHEDGIVGAINVLNPAYHALVAGYEAYQAYQRGDYFSMGRQGFHSAFNVVATVGIAAGGAGLVMRFAGAGEAGVVAAAGEAGETASVASDAAAASDTAVATDSAAADSAAASDATAAKEADLSEAGMDKAFAEWEPGDPSAPVEPVEIELTPEKADALWDAASSGKVKWMAGDAELLDTFNAAKAAGRTGATGRLGFNLLRRRLANRMQLNGPIHHWRFPMRQYAGEAMEAPSLYLTEPMQFGTSSISTHLLIHRAVGLTRWPWSRMTPGMAEPGFQMMFNFTL